MIDSESHPIIVLGVERSGTSVVAEMVHRWGAYAGPPEKLHKADAHAPRGYWEFLPLWDLLAELGDFDAGATWWDKDFQRQVERKAALFLGYEDIVRQPRLQAERLACFLNSKFGKQVSPIQTMVDVVEPRLWRNNCGIPFNQVPEATAEQKALYTFARQKIENPLEPFDVSKYPLTPGYLEFLNIQEALLKACRELEHQ